MNRRNVFLVAVTLFASVTGCRGKPKRETPGVQVFYIDPDGTHGGSPLAGCGNRERPCLSFSQLSIENPVEISVDLIQLSSTPESDR